MKRSEYSRSETHFTFFMVGLSCMLIYSIVDLESFVLLRYLGRTSYDAQTITFFIRRFNLMIGILSTTVTIFFGVTVVCANWHWLLFILYFLATLYIYLLSNSYICINKLALLPIFIISLISHGMLISTIKYIFEGSYNKYDSDTGLCLLILLCGCYTSGLLVKFLIRISGDFKHINDDDYPGLELFNRLFILFTIMTLITSFLLSRLPCEPEDENISSKSANKTLKNVINSRSCYVFYMGCVSFSFSPMLNNITLSIINQISMLKAFNIEYIQFIICLGITLTIYLLILTNVIYIYSKGGRTETLYDIICRILRISNEANPDIVVDDSIVEDLVSNQSLGIRLFRTPQPWCYLQYGFWTKWENYDCVDHVRVFSLLSIKMLITKIRGGEDFINYPDDCTKYKTLQDQYLDILDAKYTLIWMLCCFIKQCNDVICTIPYILHSCESSVVDCKCSTSNNCCCPSEVNYIQCTCILTCLKNCCNGNGKCECFSKCFNNLFNTNMFKNDFNFIDSSCYACSKSGYPAYRSFVYGILSTCACEARTLIKNITKSPDLKDDLKIDKSIELSLTVLEEFIQKFFGIMVYSRVADEILLLFEQMPKISFNITKSLLCFLCKCCCKGNGNCNCLEEENNGFKCKCVCVLYAKFIRCICLLHKKQNQVCRIILGYSKESLSSVLPTLSMTRAVSLFSSYFGRYMDAPSMIEPSTCKCNNGSGNCKCGKWSTRVNDLLDMMYDGLEFLSEYDGVLSLITFFLSYFQQWKLEDVSSTTNAQCTCCCGTTKSCSCASGNTCKCCICCLCCCCKPDCSGSCCTAGSCKCCFCCLCCEKCCTDGTSGTCSCCICSDKCCEKCCGNSKCKCCGSKDKECCFDCCFCCYIKREIKERKENASCGLLKLSENSKKNLELITSTRRSMILQSISDYVAKYNAFRDIVKNLNSGYVGLRIFNLYLFICAIIYLFCIVGNAIPYLRNTNVNSRLTFLITFFSCITSISIIYSFLYLSDFNRDSSLLINVVILISMILCILWSWATQWLSYRMLLFNQFEHFYSKFRLIYTGNVNLYKPNVRWWFEGLLSFIKTDFNILYVILTMKNLSEFYDPFSFGFTSKLKVNYNYLNVNEYNIDPERSLNKHIITKNEFKSNMETLLFNLSNYGINYELELLLDYRSFQQIPPDDYKFMTDLYPYEKLYYSIDMLFGSWKLGVLMTHKSDRLQFMREHALRNVENKIQDEVKMNNYDHKLLFKLKYYFDFRSNVLLDLADNCINDSINYGNKLSSIGSNVLVSLYQSEYTRRFDKYLNDIELNNQESEYSHLQSQSQVEEQINNEEPQPSTSGYNESQPGPSNIIQSESNIYSAGILKTSTSNTYKPPLPDFLLKKCREWKIKRLHICDTIYNGDLVCKSVIMKTVDELELLILDGKNKDPLDSFITLIQSKSNDDDEVSDDLKIARFLSTVSKSGNMNELDKLKSEISELILRDTSMNKFFGSILKGYLSVSRNIYYESTMATYFNRNEEIIVGEWIRWQGQHISSNILKVLSKFVSIDTTK